MRLQILFLAVLFAMICEYHCQGNASRPSGWNYDRNYQVDDTSNENTDNSNYENDDNYDYDNNYNNRKKYKNRNNYDDDNYNDDDYSKYDDDDQKYDDDNYEDNSYDKKPSYDDDKSYDKKPSYDDGKSYDKKPSYDDDKSYDKKPSYDDDKSYDRKPSYDDDKGSSEYRSQRRRKSPDEYGNMNLYFRSSSKGGKRKKYTKLRFPVHRFERKHAPRFPPLLSFLPWLPIFADRRTKQTIIFSPTGGVYIIPPVINFYGDLFSIAELIASGYCSLVSTGVPPPPAVNVAPLVQSGAVVGPGIPPPNVATGGFVGGVATELRKLRRPKYPTTINSPAPEYKDKPKYSSGGYGY